MWFCVTLNVLLVFSMLKFSHERKSYHFALKPIAWASKYFYNNIVKIISSLTFKITSFKKTHSSKWNKLHKNVPLLTDAEQKISTRYFVNLKLIDECSLNVTKWRKIISLSDGDLMKLKLTLYYFFDRYKVNKNAKMSFM